jgi:hypothetical protein
VFLVAISRDGSTPRSRFPATIGFQDRFVAAPATQYFGRDNVGPERADTSFGLPNMP